MSEEKNYFHINNTLINDLWVVDVGSQDIVDYHPIENNYPYFLIQYIVKGSGYIEINGVTHVIKSKQYFVVFPDTNIKYYSDTNNPWAYYWINFNGLSALKLLAKIGITKDNFYSKEDIPSLEKYFKKAYRASELRNSTDFAVEACLFEIFAEILESRPYMPIVRTSEPTLFQNILSFVQDNLLKSQLTAEFVARHFFLNTNYFSTLFKKNCNVTFKEYVNYERIKKASTLLSTTNEPLKNISRAVGFLDPLYFSKVFKKYRLMSPSDYRNENKEKKN